MSDWTDGPVTVHVGGALDVLRRMPDESVHAVVTSPPYWGLRYGLPPQAHALGRPAGPPLTLDAVRALLEALASGAGRAGERAAKRVEQGQLPLA